MQVMLDKTERDNTAANERITRLKREAAEAAATNLQMRADNAAQASHLHSQVSMVVVQCSQLSMLDRHVQCSILRVCLPSA